MNGIYQYVQLIAPYAEQGLSVAIIVVGAFILSSISRRMINRLRGAAHLTPIMAKRIHTFRRWLFWIVTVLVVLGELGAFNSAWSLITAGLAAFSIGFVAAWSMLSNATAALLVITFRPFRIGDEIEIMDSDGKSLGGRVLDLNLMYTSLLLAKNPEDSDAKKYFRVPNILLFQKIIRVGSAHEHDSNASFFDTKE